jgi:hypothetical protein
MGVGDDFVIALGLTMPFTELAKIIKERNMPKARSRSGFNIKRLKKDSDCKSQHTDKRLRQSVGSGQVLAHRLTNDMTNLKDLSSITMKSNKTLISNSDIISQKQPAYVKPPFQENIENRP